MITSHRDLHALQNYDYNSRSAFKFHSKFGWNRRDQPRSGGIGSHLIRSDIRQRIGAARMAWPRERRMGLGRRAREPSPPSHGWVQGRGFAPSLGRMLEGGACPSFMGRAREGAWPSFRKRGRPVDPAVGAPNAEEWRQVAEATCRLTVVSHPGRATLRSTPGPRPLLRPGPTNRSRMY